VWPQAGWNRQLAEPFKLIAIDIRGHGESSKPTILIAIVDVAFTGQSNRFEGNWLQTAEAKPCALGSRAARGELPAPH
jgi:hypothetical protein